MPTFWSRRIQSQSIIQFTRNLLWRGLRCCGMGGVLVALASACGCKRNAATASVEQPTLRLHLVANLAGALEPCGCVKDMLGGMDHAAAHVHAQSLPQSLVLGAGPMLYQNPSVSEQRRVQEEFKAEAVAQALKVIKLAAWAPGNNDFAAGVDRLTQLASGISLLAPTEAGVPGGQLVRVFDVQGKRVGVAGLTRGLSTGLEIKSLLVNAKQALDQAGVQIRVLLAVAPRGELLRMLEAVPGFHLVLVGKAVEQGETNDPPVPPLILGHTLVVEPQNHLQSLAEVDFFVRGDDFEFEDGSHLTIAEQRVSLEQRIQEIESRLQIAKNSGQIRDEDLQARAADLTRLQRQLRELVNPPPPKGSYFQYRLVEVREGAGKDKGVEQVLREYYRRVNNHNREAFKDHLPAPVASGQSRYVGVEQCANCHVSARQFWEKTQHASAYPTLSKQEKQFNLDCVSCHVTGYERPGGSTVAHVSGFENVQCEVCHGPGARHIENPADRSLIKFPDRSLCASECHHPPHVKPDWSVDNAWPHIIGPGHGR